MIILDTNVVSEPAKLRPDSAVINWIEQQIAETLYLTSISLAELLVGIETMPRGEGKQGLAADLKSLLNGFLDRTFCLLSKMLLSPMRDL